MNRLRIRNSLSRRTPRLHIRVQRCHEDAYGYLSRGMFTFGMAATTAVDFACDGLKEIKHQLKSISTVGGGQPTSGLLTAAADNCTDAVIITSTQAEIRIVNGAAARITGISTRELQTQTLWDITHATSQANFDVLWKEFLRAGRQRGGFSLRHRDGAAVDVAYCGEAHVLPELHVFVLRKAS